MPPYIEVETHGNDDWSWLTTASSTAVNENSSKLNNNDHNNDLSSPLFRDDDSNIPPPSRLDRRQSDPDFTTLSAKHEEDTHIIINKPLAAHPPVVSRITAIIGPESAYVRTNCSVNNSTTNASSNTPPSTSTASIPKREPIVYKNGIPQKKKPLSSSSSGNSGENEDGNNKPVFLRRATKLVSKKGWRVVKSLPNKLISTVNSVKIPGVHKNVV